MKVAAVLPLSALCVVASAQASLFAQCGGSSFEGETSCESGTSCVEFNEWYSQCLPSGDSAPPSATTTDEASAEPTSVDEEGGEEQEQEEEEDADEDEDDDSSSSSSISAVPSVTATASATATATSSSGAGSESGSGSGSGTTPTGVTTTLPASQGVVATDAPITITGDFDGEMQEYQRSPNVCQDQGETGQDEAMFVLEDGATLSNVIVGEGQAEGVHCLGTCTLNNVWFATVCEDAMSFKQEGGVSYINGGGAFDAADKIVQFNGAGEVHISNFYAENYGKLARSCGNCDGNGADRHFVIENVVAVNGGELCGVNANFGDTCTITGSCQNEGKACTVWNGNDSGDEPDKIGTEPDGETCIAESFSETC